MYEAGEVYFFVLRKNGLHLNSENKIFNAASSRCRRNLKYGNFTSSFGRRQNIALKSVPHVQHDYLSSFNKTNQSFPRYRCRCCRHFLRPGQVLAMFQRNLLQHCCNMWMLMCPGPWHTTNGPSAHALVQQWTWPNDYNITQHPKCCTKNLTVFKVDPGSSDMS